MDSETPNIAPEMIADAIDAPALAAAAMAANAQVQLALQAAALVPGQDGQLVLPEGVSLNDIRVAGRDLIVKLPDGSEVVIPDGAVFVPQFVIDGIAVPPLNIAALLIGQEPAPAAGRPTSSGGNFADPVGDIGDPFARGDLLPPTQLAFPEPEEREIIPNLVDRDPDVNIQDGGPAGKDVIDNVSEVGLPGTRTNGNVESPGSSAGNGSDSTTGTIIITSPDGIGSITINGIVYTGAAGQQITTPNGVLTLGALTDGQIPYTYRLIDNTSGDSTTDVFTVVVTDPDGDSSTARLTIAIADDVPTARNDTDSVAGGTYGPETGNVLSGAGTTSGSAGADTLGADGGTITGIRAGTSGSFGAVGTTINGQYGTLTLGANGTYSYVRNVNTPGGVTDVFTYQLTDGDGDSSTATLTINIGDAPNRIVFVPEIGDGTQVREPHLPVRDGEPSGSQFDGNPESTSGTITFNSPDGVGSVTVSGVTITPGALPQQVVSDATGTLVITAYSYDPVTGNGSITYTYTLNDNTLNTAGSTVTFPIVVTDLDGDVASDDLNIKIIDDAPLAVNDSAAQESENAPVTVNVFSNDTPGADAVNLSTGVAVVAESLSGAGSLVYNGDGTFTYTPAPGEEGVVTFQYTITDGDGDPSTATVTITLLKDSEPRVDVSGENFVDEAGLPARGSEPEGSNEESGSETTGGTIAISTGGDTLQSLVINGVNVTAGGTVTGAHGTLTVTVSEGAYSYSYTLTDNTSGEGTTDSFNVVVTDSDGDSANDTLVIGIHDDAPTAIKDADSIAAGEYGPATGNVITDAEGDGGADTPGADGVTVTAISGFGGAGAVDGTTNGQYGVLTLNADGSYSYARNPGTPGGVSDVFSYTITDGDGDPSTATLTIDIGDSRTTLDLPTEGEAGTQVEEAGLPAGSDAGADSELTAGTIAYTAPDGPATVTIDGVAVTAVGQTFTGSFGTLTITSIAAGAIGYEYELTTNTSGDATFDDFAVVVTDQDGDNTPGTLVIDIVDDVPTARADIDSVKEDGPTVADGNVISGANVADANATDGVADTKGADGATVTAVAFGATNGTVGSALAGTYGSLTLNADGSYSYTLNNDDPRVQGLDSDDSLTEIFTYTITDGDGDPSTTTLTITINGSDDIITINGLNVEGPDLIVDEDDLPVRGVEPAGSDTTPDSLTQTGSFTVNGLDGIASIKIEGTETFVGQSFATAYGTFTITSISAPADGNATAITIGYSYVLTDNTAHANAGGQNFLTELFDVAVTDTDGSTDTDQVEVRIVDDVPTAKPDGTYSVAEQTALTFDALANDVQGADGVNLVTGVAIATNPSKGTVVYNDDGTFTYTPNAGAEGPDSFTYTITDADGDPSTTTVTFDLLKDSVPNILRIANLTVDEDGLPNANVDAAPLQASPSETDSTESATASGTAVVNFGADVPANLLASIKLVDTGALDGQLKTLDGVDVVFALESGALVGRSGGAEVIRIEVSGAVLGPNPGDVTYSYSTTLSQPVKHVASGSEDSVTLNGVTFEVTDSETDTATGSFNVTVVDDVPSLNVTKGEDAGVVLVTQDAETDGVPTAEDVATSAANFGGVFGLTSTAGADGAVAPSLAFVLNTAGGASGLTSHGVAINLFKVGNVIVGSTSATAPASATAASVVFSVAVSGTGVVTLTQYSQIDHALPGEANGPYDDQFATLLDSAITLTASSTITDGDGDTASDSETVNIGANISFADDGPVLTNASGNSSVTLDETTAGSPAGFGVAGISQTSAAAIVTATAAFGADGAAAGNATTYALSVVGGGVTALQTAIGNHAISLSLSPDGKTVTGSYNDGSVKTAFTATINANGTLTVTQFVPLEHLVDGGPGAAHDDALTLSGLINATITITDFDGDTDSETVAVGDRVTFKDDGPSLNVTMGSDANAVLITQDADTIGANSDTDTSSANFDGVFGLTSNGGADGAAAPSLAFDLNVANGVSGLTSNGAAINLYKVGGVIVGSTAGTAPASATDASVVFSVAVSGTGVVTLTQYSQIDHPIGTDPGASATPFDDHVAVLANGKITLTASSTITDNDGDTASDSETIDLGGNIAFADHGPDITLTLTGTQIRIDETDGVVAAGGEVDPAGGNLGSVTMTAASLFTLTNAVTSADAPTSYAYNFVLPSEGANSGLLLSTTNTAILLYTAAPGVIEGRVGGIGGAVAFTVSVNPTSGAVTVTQNLAVEHPTGGASHDEDSSPLTAGALTLRVTATDFDGDTDTANVDLGSIIRFEDDGPTINVTKGEDVGVSLITQDAETDGAPTAEDVATSAANFGGVFGLTSTAGADGAATPSLAFTLNTVGGASGLTSHGTAINLFKIGNVIVGSTSAIAPATATAASVVFSVAVSGTGVVTLTQYSQIDHALPGEANGPYDDQFASLLDSAITLTASSSITDGDGDTASDSETVNIGANISFADDGPVLTNASGNSSVTLDETTAGSPVGFGVAGISQTSAAAIVTATAAFGADGAAAANATTYALSVVGGGVTTLQTAIGNHAISLSLSPDGKTVTGSYNDGAVKTAFTATVNANGTLTVTQFVPLEHLVDGGPGAAHDDALTLSGLINATITITDFDGDTDSETVAIGDRITFKDDGPTLNITVGSDANVVLITQDADTIGTNTDTDTSSANFGGVFGLTSNGGADGAATPSLAFSLNVANSVSGLTSNGAAINLYLIAGKVVGSTAANAGAVTADNTVFDIATSNTGVVTLTQYSQIDHPIGTDPSATAAPFVDHVAVLANGKVTLTASSTITDNDGDTASDSETIDLGGNIAFADHGPDVTLTLTGTQIRIDETDGVVAAGGEVDPAGGNLGSVTMTAASLFTLTNAVTSADAPTSYAYNFVLPSEGANSGLLLSTTNTAILLYTAAPGVIEGRVGGIGGAVAFTVSVNPTSGAVTVTQNLAVEHPTGGASHDEDSSPLTAGALTLRVTATDFDGDTDTANVDLGSIIRFEDDGPTINVTKGEDVGVSLITQDAETDGAPTAEDVATSAANFGGVFGLTSTAGADGAATPSLAFTLNTVGGASGLTSHGTAINLFKIGNVIVGSTSAIAPATATAASVVFSVAVSGTGVVTLTQYSQIDHALPGEANGPYDDQFASLLDSAITLTASSSITDGDGDTASDSETVNIGANISFADDGPVLTNASGNSSVTLDETTAGSPVGFGVAGISQTSAAAIVTATAAFGADGAAAANATTYALSVVGGGVTTLQTAIGNHAISLSLSPDGKTVTGSYNDGAVKTAFTATVNANGTLTVTQFVPLEHLVDGGPGAAHDDALTLSGLINATITITDFDGDTDSETVAIGDRITFKDDGPTLNITVGSDANVVLITQDADTIGTNTDTDTSSANFGGVFGLTSNGGADGAATPSLAFSLNVANSVSGLTSNGAAINLYLIAGKVVGSTAANAGAVTADNTVFDIATSNTGVVTLTQYSQIDHPIGTDPSATAAPFVDHVAVLANGKVTLTASSTITDNDGDTASDSETIDLGGNIAFADHGPDVTLTLTGTQIRIDETDGVVAAGGEVDPAGGNLGSVTMTAASLFTLTNAVTSADAPTSYAYNFVLPSEGANSGLLLSTTNTAILLYTAAPGVIEGRVGGIGGAVAFTVSVNPTSGAVTVTQNLAVEHPTGGASHDEDSSPLTAGALTLRVTATDFDGDTDTANVDLGSIIRFEDDGPTINVTKGEDVGVSLITQDAETDGAPTAEDVATSAANFGGVFGLTSTAGADGAATPSLAFTLNTVGGASGLTSHGTAINLFKIGNVIVGSTSAIAPATATAASVVFSVAVSGTGVVTLTQYSQIDHALPGEANGPYDDQFASLLDSAITLTASSSITDGDGDTASDSETVNIGANISFADDGPVLTNASGNSSVTLDETTAGSPVGFGVAGISQTSAAAIVTATAAFGADGAAAANATTYALSVVGGGVTTLQTAIGNHAISLSLSPDGKTVTGSYNDGAVKTAFTATVNANGTLTVTQFVPLEHLVDGGPGAAHDDALTLSGLINATITITDFDGDTDSETVAIGDRITFKDDGPTLNITVGSDANVVLITQDADTIGTNTDTDTSSANFGGVFGLTSNGGADGAATPSLAFSLNVANSVSGLTSNGAAINLYLIAGKVVGSTAANAGAVTADNTVFDIATSNTGVVTLTQYSQIDHPIGTDPSATAAPFVDHVAVLANGKVTLTASSTITDNDGDTASDSETIDLGGNIAFADHGPDVTLTLTGTQIRIDETDGVVAAGGEVDPAGGNLGSVTMTAASLFTLTNAVTSADAPTSYAYNFVLPIEGANSGLLLSTTNTAILLYTAAPGVIEGRVGGIGGAVAFTVSVNPTSGAVTVTQNLAVEHPTGGASHDEDSSPLTAGALTLRVTATDFDGDTDTANVDLGSIIRFEDDGPTINVTKGGDAAVVLATQDAETIGGASDSAASAANFAGVFGLTSTSGADGAATPTLSYALTLAVAAGTNSGLTIGGTAIKLYNVGGVIVGSTALSAPASATDASVVFSLGVNGSGVVTLTQYQQIDHPIGTDPTATEAPFADHSVLLANGLVNLTASSTITDNDGDTASDSETIDLGGNVRFDDHGPSVSTTGVVPTLTVDETTLLTDASASFAANFTVNYGADGAGSTIYTLGAVSGASGLVDTATGEAVHLRVVGGVVEGYSVTTNQLVFTVTVNGSGSVTLNQLRAVAHTPNTTADQSTGLTAANLVTLTATATDFDGDTAKQTINIGDKLIFKDDGPAIDIAASGTTLILDESLGTTGSVQNEGGRVNNDETLAGAAVGAIGYATGSIVSLVSANAGADGEASRVYSLTVNNATSGLVDAVTNSNIVLVSVNATTVEGRVGSSGGAVSFRITVDPVNGTATINQFRAVEHNDSTNHDENGGSEALMNSGVLSLGVTLTDRDNDAANDTVDISQLFKFEDDGPSAVADVKATVVVDQDINAAMVLDFSGSIDNDELSEMLSAVKDAAYELFTNTTGTVVIKLVIFGTDSISYPLINSYDAFVTQLDLLNGQLAGGTRPTSISGGTDYTDAIQELMSVYTPSLTANNQVFFLSDGNPNEQTGTGALLNATATAWNNFVDNNGINVTAIGVGNGIDTGPLQDIDVDGTGVPILAENFDDLIATLIQAVQPPISDNVLTNDALGTDGGRVSSITINGITYTWNGATTISASSGPAIPAGTTMTVPTPLGGQMFFNFASGAWTYTPPANYTGSSDEVFQYSVVDGDGDISQSTLTIDVAAVSGGSNFAKNEYIFTNQGTNTIIPEGVLLANDAAGTAITGIASSSGAASVVQSGGNVTFNDTGAAGGSFIYNAASGTASDTAYVAINRAQAGEATLDGTGASEVLLGRDGSTADTLNGNAGNDKLYGLGGADTLVGGAGADMMTGGAGADTFTIASGNTALTISGSGNNGVVTGYDVITDFVVGTDILNLNGTPTAAANTTGVNGNDSALTVGGSTIKSHAISNGIITFDDANTFGSALTLNTAGDLAAAVQYLRANDLGSSNVTVAFSVGGSTYIFQQTSNSNSTTGSSDILVQLQGVTISNLSTLIGSTVTPVVLDLDGDGAEFLSSTAGVAFDYAGDGNPESTAWVSADDGLLAIDRNGNGLVDDGSEIIFGGNGLTDLEGLAANYDSNKDGVLDASDVDFAKFGVWQDANSNGVTDAGEFQSLTDAGITSVKLVSDGVVYSAAGGDVTVHGTSSYTKADGSTGLVADASFAIGAAQTQQREQVQANTLVAASLVALAGADILLQDAAAGAVREGLVSRELDVDTVSQAANQPYQADGIEQPALSAQDLLKVETVELVQQDDMPTTQLWDVNRFDQQERFDIDQADFNQAAAEPIVHDALSMLSMPVEIGSMEALLIAHTASDGAVEVQTAALQEVIADTLNDNGIDHLLDQLTGPADGPLLGANDAFGGNEDFAAALIDMPVNADSFAHFSSITVSDQLQEMAASHA